MLIQSRRRFLTGAVSILASPAIVRAASIMPVKAALDLPAIDRIPVVCNEKLFSEIAAITRRAFIPSLIVQIYDVNPLVRKLCE